VVGAGITGLSAAIRIAESGRNVVVIDRDFTSGATSRSGGVVLGDTLVGPVADFAGCDRTLRRWIEDSGADCDLFWHGSVELARDPALPADPIDWRDGCAVRLAARAGGGVVNPVKLRSALADTAQRSGATIVDGVTLASLESDPGGILATTDCGSIAARHGIMAVDAVARSTAFDPWSERLITVALQTAPMSTAELARAGLAPHESFYTRDLPLLWGRVMPDRSVLIGRETTPVLEQGGYDIASAGARLTARVRQLHDVFAGIDIQRIWGGAIARSTAGVPAVLPDPRHPRVLWAGGYGGHGLAQAFTLGRLIADRVHDDHRRAR
jgi:glycine/D-amino acid oxidase-like deaminating enzyme